MSKLLLIIASSGSTLWEKTKEWDVKTENPPQRFHLIGSDLVHIIQHADQLTTMASMKKLFEDHGDHPEFYIAYHLESVNLEQVRGVLGDSLEGSADFRNNPGLNHVYDALNALLKFPSRQSLTNVIRVLKSPPQLEAYLAVVRYLCASQKEEAVKKINEYDQDVHAEADSTELELWKKLKDRVASFDAGNRDAEIGQLAEEFLEFMRRELVSIYPALRDCE